MAPPPPRRPHRLSIEPLEARDVPATLLVNSLLDVTSPGDGLVTLREAITAANSDAATDLGQTGSGADMITFDPALFGAGPGTITLGGAHLAITAPLTINGPGSATLTINGDNLSRIFRVFDLDLSSTFDVAIAGLTLTGGNSSDSSEPGGGANSGGAIHNRENLTLTGCTISGNSASAGGGIYNITGSLVLTGCTISGNSASAAFEGGRGGGIYSESATVIMTDCTVSGNAAAQGSGILSGRGIQSIGPEILVGFSSLTMTGCTVSGNTATSYGGGIDNNGTVDLTNCTLSGNSAAGGGAGILNRSGGAVTLTNCTLSGNTAAAGPGGGIANNDTVQLSGSTLSNNSATGGGGLYNTGSVLALSGCTISGNSVASGFGGGILNVSTTAITLSGSTLLDNTAASGGGVFNGGSKLVLTGCTLSNNVAISGGGIYNDTDAVLELSGCHLSGNSGTFGGGIRNSLRGGVSLSNCSLTNNSATEEGGGILNERLGTLDLIRCTFSGNSAALGGGFSNSTEGISTGGTVTLIDCTLSNNSATHTGGGIHNIGSLTLTGSTLSGNSAAEGGGIYNVGFRLALTQCTLSANSATTGGGISDITPSIYSERTGMLIGCTLSGNSASSGGGIFTHSSLGMLILTNTVVANSVGSADVDGSLSGSHNLIEDGSGGLADTITGDPMLGPLTDNGGPTLTHAPLPGSPAIDAGNTAAAAGLLADQRGFVPRVVGGAVDIGSVEIGAISPFPPLAVGGSKDGSAVLFSPAAGKYEATPAATLAPLGAIPANVRTATGDVNADGFPDTILITGPGVPVRFAVVSGADNATLLVSPTAAFTGSEDFLGGGFASAADFDGDGRVEMVFTPDLGGGPRVTILSLDLDGTLAERASFFGIDDPGFRGGARSGTGDVNGDEIPDLAVAAGFEGGPRIAVFDGATILTTRAKLLNDFFAFEDTLRNGAYVAIGDLDGDGFGDLFFGAGLGGAPRVLVVSGRQLLNDGPVSAIASPLASFFVAGDVSDRGGVRVVTKDADGDSLIDLAAGSGQGSPASVRVYLGKDFVGTAEPSAFQDLSVFGGAVLADGVFVG